MFLSPQPKKPKRQIRRTAEDTLDAQREILKIVDTKIEKNVSLSTDEEKIFQKLLYQSILSRLSYPVTFRAFDDRVVHLGTMYTFYDILMSQKGAREVIIVDRRSGTRYITPYVELWKCFKTYILKLFPYAIEEAIHMSAEAPVREEATSFGISLDK